MSEIMYEPARRNRPPRVLEGYPSSWVGLESVLDDLLTRFSLSRNCALEFGVEYAYSTIALSNFFNRVIGVDPFGQKALDGRDMCEVAMENVKPYPNIFLLRMSWQTFTESVSDDQYDLIHIDAEHNYEEAYGNGAWAVQHSTVTIFHDTESFPEVKRAVIELAEKFDRPFYNLPEFHGLGLLVST